jgi:hypothetical protein
MWKTLLSGLVGAMFSIIVPILGVLGMMIAVGPFLLMPEEDLLK